MSKQMLIFMDTGCGHYAVQGRSRSPILLPVESPYVTSYV